MPTINGASTDVRFTSTGSVLDFLRQCLPGRAEVLARRSDMTNLGDPHSRRALAAAKLTGAEIGFLVDFLGGFITSHEVRNLLPLAQRGQVHSMGREDFKSHPRYDIFVELCVNLLYLEMAWRSRMLLSGPGLSSPDETPAIKALAANFEGQFLQELLDLIQARDAPTDVSGRLGRYLEAVRQELPQPFDDRRVSRVGEKVWELMLDDGLGPSQARTLVRATSGYLRNGDRQRIARHRVGVFLASFDEDIRETAPQLLYLLEAHYYVTLAIMTALSPDHYTGSLSGDLAIIGRRPIRQDGSDSVVSVLFPHG